MGRQVTLKDIATALNVSMTTVHRALYNKEGISDAMRQAVLNKAEDLGYTTNYIASSLKRRAMKIAAVLPTPEGSGRYYHRQLWDAVNACETEANDLNVQISYYPYPEDNTQYHYEVLDRVFRENQGALDGLLLMPAEYDENMRRAISRFTEQGVAVVLLDNDVPESGRICCVAPHNTSTGRLGGELLSMMNLPEGQVLVAGGNQNSASHVHNVQGLCNYLNERGGKLKPLVMHNYNDLDATYHQAMEILRSNPDIVAFYSVTARETVPLTQAVIDSGLAGKLRGIGSDLFPETAKFLQEDVIQAIIDKNAYARGECGFKALFSYLVKKITPPSTSVTVPIGIVMKNNLPFFLDRL